MAEAILSGGERDAPAVYYGRQMVSHGELRAAACAWDRRLRARGPAPGDRIGLFAENGPFFIAAYLGTIRAGLCSVPFPVDCGETTFARIVTSTGMNRLLVSARFHPHVRFWAQRLGVELVVETSALPAAEDGFAPPADVDPEGDLAAVMFTSGSTGDVKGVMVTHHNILVNTEDILGYVGITADDRTMTVLPFYYCFGTSLLHTHLMAGGSLVLNNRFLFPEKVLDEMAERCCTGLAGVPATYQILLRKTRFAQRPFPALRWLQQAGGRLPSPLVGEIRQAFPAVKFFVMYGQTEATARLSYLPPGPPRRQARLDRPRAAAHAARGPPPRRLARPTRAPTRSARSWPPARTSPWATGATPEETARFFRDGKLYTGDMARVDADGFIFLVERARDFIKPMGHRVGPKEVEEVLAEMPEIVEAAVVGVPDELWGEAIRAFVVTVRPGQLTADDVQRHCLKRLPNYKVPQHVEFLPQVAQDRQRQGR